MDPHAPWMIGESDDPRSHSLMMDELCAMSEAKEIAQMHLDWAEEMDRHDQEQEAT